VANRIFGGGLAAFLTARLTASAIFRGQSRIFWRLAANSEAQVSMCDVYVYVFLVQFQRITSCNG